MKRINIYLPEKQIHALKALDGTFAENVRRAIDNYLEGYFSVSTSESGVVTYGNESGNKKEE